MHCPHLAELPPPPEGKTGWPWTVETPPLPPTRPDGSPWPRVSIVTPSYNQAQFIEETIRSVLLQGYPDLEYIVVDGDSSDETVDIIRKYDPWITHWVSEMDKGQADAINKGLVQCTGNIFQFINSDDYLALDALRIVSNAMTGRDAVAGVVIDFDGDGSFNPRACRKLRSENFVTRAKGFLCHQPGVWLQTDKVKALGGFDVFYRYKFDWALQLCYFERWPRVAYIDSQLAFFRMHSQSKTVAEGEGFWPEQLLAYDRLARTAVGPKLRRVLRSAVRRHRWKERVDELREGSGYGRREAALQLCLEVLCDPFHRIDRYTLGSIRKVMVG